MAQRILTTHEATVQTVQVEIQVLKVGKKQVTMGLFRQLPREVLLDPDTLQLRGVPWGHVQYWWEGATGAGTAAGDRLPDPRSCPYRGVPDPDSTPSG